MKNNKVSTNNEAVRRVRGVHLFAPIVLALGIVITGSLASAASVTPKRDVAGAKTVKPDYAYFKGKTITYIVPNQAGSQGGNIAVALQPYMEQTLGATINIEYVPGANVVGQDEVGKSAPNGLTIGDMPLVSDLNSIFTNSGALSFPLQSATFFGSTVEGPYLIAGCLGSSFKTIQQVIDGSAPVSVVNAPLLAASLSAHLFFRSYPTASVTFLNGYTSSNQTAGCLRGDGNIVFDALANITNAAGTGLTPGLTPLALTGPVPPGSGLAYLNQQVPTITTMLTKYPPKTAAEKKALKADIIFSGPSSPQYAIYGPKGIPKAEALALADAVKLAFRHASVHNELNFMSLPTPFYSPEKIYAYIKSEIKDQQYFDQLLGTA